MAFSSSSLGSTSSLAAAGAHVRVVKLGHDHGKLIHAWLLVVATGFCPRAGRQRLTDGQVDCAGGARHERNPSGLALPTIGRVRCIRSNPRFSTLAGAVAVGPRKVSAKAVRIASRGDRRLKS